MDFHVEVYPALVPELLMHAGAYYWFWSSATWFIYIRVTPLSIS